MTLLDDIINGATDDAVSTSNLLRKVQVVAHRLEAIEIQTWVQRELNGHESNVELPRYRADIETTVTGQWSGPFQSSATNLVSEMGVPEECATALFKVDILQSVAELEELVNADGDPGMAWDPAFVAQYNSWMGTHPIPHLQGFVLFAARKVVGRSVIRGIIDSTRNTALDFALKLQSADPNAGAQRGPTVADAQVQQVVWNVSNIIYGDGAQVAHGTGITQKSKVAKGDIEGLLRVARELGLNELGNVELASAVTASDADRPRRLKSFLAKLGEGTFLVGTGITADIVASQINTLIQMYLGQS